MRYGFLLVLLCLLATGCAPRTTVILLPDENGTVGAVEVQTANARQVIDVQDSYTSVGFLDTPSAVRRMDARTISKEFAVALAAEPAPAESYYLYFHSESTTLDNASQALFPKIVAAIHRKANVEINVIGHTDRAGEKSYNMALSRRRAEQVRNMLVRDDIPEDIIFISYHGENDPLIPTPDGVHEPRNRRVEVFLR